MERATKQKIARAITVVVILWLAGTNLAFAMSHPRATQTQVLLWTPWIVTLQWEGLEP